MSTGKQDAHIVAELREQLEQYRANLATNLPRIVGEDDRSVAAIARDAYAPGWCAPGGTRARAAERRLQRQLAGSEVTPDDVNALATVLGVDPSAFYAPIAD